MKYEKCPECGGEVLREKHTFTGRQVRNTIVSAAVGPRSRTRVLPYGRSCRRPRTMMSPSKKRAPT